MAVAIAKALPIALLASTQTLFHMFKPRGKKITPTKGQPVSSTATLPINKHLVFSPRSQADAPSMTRFITEALGRNDVDA